MVGSNSPLITFVSGGVAGLVSRTTTAPLDRIKVLMQANQKETSFLMTVRKIFKNESILAFYKGNGANVLKIMPETSLKFFSYDAIKKFFCENPKDPRFIESLASGAVAGVISQLCIYPLEITKTRLALSSKKTYSGIFDCMRKITKHEGFFSLYKGMGASMMGVIPYSSVDLALFFFMKNFYIKKYNDEPNIGNLLLFGALSGMTAQFVAYPFALVRTRL